jgi:hydrogenase nickel incorporation protein HypA/HybF
MHELGIVYQVIKAVDEVKAEQSLSEIKSITLEIGEMSDVVPKFIGEAWSAVKSTTDYPNCDMIINVIPAVARCKNCSFKDYVKNINFECPKCKSTDFEIVTGREFLIKEICAK